MENREYARILYETADLMEIAGDELYFQTVSRGGKTVDSGSFKRPAEPRKNG